jgi:CheY-like chemotaxis protein
MCDFLSLLAVVGTVAPAKSWLNRSSHTIDVLLVDLGLPDGDELEVVRSAFARNPCCEPLVISIFGDEANVLSGIKSGALGYIHKNLDLQFGTHRNRTDATRERRHAIAGLSSSALFSASRRAWVFGACAAATAIALVGADHPLSWIEPAFADTPTGSGLDAFLSLSQRLTGRTGLDAILGKRIYDALAKSDSQFTQNVGALNTWLQGHDGVLSDTVTQALQSDRSALAKSVGLIMRAWYLGLVGDMPHANVVAYETALMFAPVKDVLTIPSYCRDVPFYWTQKPVGT